MGQINLDGFTSSNLQLDLDAVDVTERPESARYFDSESSVSPLQSTPTTSTVAAKPIPSPSSPAVPKAPSEPEFKIPYGPLRVLNPSRMSLKYHLFDQLNATIPLNEFDLPNYYYRADMLDHNAIREGLLEIQPGSSLDGMQSAVQATPTATILSPHKRRFSKLRELQTSLDAAIVSLDYDEGFPKTDKGFPYWQQLEAEPKEAFQAFFDYLEMGGARQLHLLVAYELPTLKSWFHIYGWNHRVRAFDLFKIANAQKLRLQRMLSTEDDHYFMAEKLLKTVARHIDTEGQSLLAQEDLGSLVGIMDKLVKVQRISLGLPAAGGPVPEQKPMGAPTINVITQQVVESGRSQHDSHEQQDQGFNILQDDPDSLELAQELIIRSQTSSNTNKAAEAAAHTSNQRYLPVIDQDPNQE